MARGALISVLAFPIESKLVEILKSSDHAVKELKKHNKPWKTLQAAQAKGK